MNCPICQQEYCDCAMRIGLAAAVLGGGDPFEAAILHKRYSKSPHYQYIITAARKLAYEGQVAAKRYLDTLALANKLIPQDEPMASAAIYKGLYEPNEPLC